MGRDFIPGEGNETKQHSATENDSYFSNFPFISPFFSKVKAKISAKKQTLQASNVHNM